MSWQWGALYAASDYVTYFSTRLHPILGIYKTHTGIDIGAGSWCANQAGILTTQSTASEPYVYKTASVQTMYNWYRNNSRNLTISTNPSSANYPKVGDLVFINGTAEHIGIIVAVSSSTITTVEGNSSDQVESVSYSMSTLKNSSGSKTLSYLGSNNTHY